METDVAGICTSVIDEVRAADPDVEVKLRTSGDMRGLWDPRRLQQVVSNLLSNAMAYRASDTPVVMELVGSICEVILTVTNKGPPIPPEALKTLFEPLQRGAPGAGPREPGTHLGLGLFVARERVKAHHGQIEAHSGMGETVFSVRLPRRVDEGASQPASPQAGA